MTFKSVQILFTENVPEAAAGMIIIPAIIIIINN